jgi:endonuclease/exonuclease/phosphatase family metal-dependent hydrolase
MRTAVIASLIVLSAAVAIPDLAQGAQDTDEATLQISILTWNVQYGRRMGNDLNGWPKRAPLLLRTLQRATPDIFCAQEALAGQVREIAEVLPGHGVVAVGRDNGATAGEHCPIFYRRTAFDFTASGTFWLSNTPDVPSRTWGSPYARICTWVELRHGRTGRTIRILNTHFPLEPDLRLRAATLVSQKLASMPAMSTLVTGDFNEAQGVSRLPALADAGLVDAYDTAREKVGCATYRLGPIPIARIDWVLTTSDWRVDSLHTIDGHEGATHASDHNGVLAVVSIDATGRAPATTSVLRVLTYNVCKGSKAADIARAIRAHAPDVALLQEVDRNTRRVDGADQPAQLGTLLSMHVYYAPSYEVDGGTTGQAILSQFPFEQVATITLTGSRNIAAHAIIARPGQPIVLISTHFSSTYELDLNHLQESSAARIREAKHIVEIAGQTGYPTIVAGDFNCGVDAEPMKLLKERLDLVPQDKPTFPAALPVLQLDCVMFMGGLQVRRAFVGVKGTSDHLPVIVEFELPEH